MAEHNKLGFQGEILALEHLICQGYTIYHSNWKSGKYELDIVAYKDLELVVVEVKTRGSSKYDLPQDAVTEKKIRNIIYATDVYLRMHNIKFPVRFDIITIIQENGEMQVEHIQDAFYPTSF